MNVRLRQLPKFAVVLLAICGLSLWLIFMGGPLYNMATNRLVPGRIVQSDTSSSTVLVNEQLYPLLNACLDGNKSGSCRLTEGAQGLFLVSAPNKTGLRFDQMLLSIVIGQLSIAAVIFALIETKFHKPEPAMQYRSRRRY